MSQTEIIRAWKDLKYRNSLSPTELKLLPDNPAGRVEVKDEDLYTQGSDASTTAVTCTCTGTRQCTIGCYW